MHLLIDGYNLLHVTGFTGSASRVRSQAGRRGPSGLQRAREALLRFLVASIDTADLPRTTIVFDAKDAIPGLPRVVDLRGMTVRYATEYVDADTLIEELIQAESAPRSLLVVSSDHRIQRAARRRRAAAMDSDRWYVDLCRRRHARQHQRQQRADKPPGPLSAAEVAYWLRQFMPETGLPETGLPETGQIDGLESAESGPGEATATPDEDAWENDAWKNDAWKNPFPPGYGEDLLDGQ